MKERNRFGTCCYTALVLGFLLILFHFPSHLSAQDRYTIAAYYYPWYGGTDNPHWPLGVAHKPWIGYYNSSSPVVAEKQIDLASKYGVDVFAVSWTGINSASEKKFKAGFMNSSNLSKIRFCIYYESLIRLGETVPGLASVDFNTPRVRELFISDLIYFAREYFNHPSYYKIRGRPVVGIYLARIFRGEFPPVLEEARQRLSAMGFNPYFIGDSAFYGRTDLYLASQFDAVTLYSPYSTSLFEDGIDTTGKLAKSLTPYFWNITDQLRDIRVRSSSTPVDFQPNVMPQFDNRIRSGTRAALLAQSKDEVREMFQAGKNFVDAKRTGEKVVWVTSWNEWHEGTAIEPTQEGGRSYPGGNYGFDFLEALSEVFAGD